MLSLLKKLFAKKAEVSATPWPFPTSKVSVKPADEPVAEAKVEVVEAVSTAKKPVAKKPKVVAKTTPRKPRAQ